MVTICLRRWHLPFSSPPLLCAVLVNHCIPPPPAIQDDWELVSTIYVYTKVPGFLPLSSCACLKHPTSSCTVYAQDETYNYQPHGHQYVLLHLLSGTNCTPKSDDETCLQNVISLLCTVSYYTFCFHAVQTSLVHSSHPAFCCLHYQ